MDDGLLALALFGSLPRSVGNRLQSKLFTVAHIYQHPADYWTKILGDLSVCFCKIKSGLCLATLGYS